MSNVPIVAITRFVMLAIMFPPFFPLEYSLHYLFKASIQDISAACFNLNQWSDHAKRGALDQARQPFIEVCDLERFQGLDDSTRRFFKSGHREPLVS